MNRKQSLAALFGLLLLICFTSLAQDIPQELQDFGFTENLLISYDEEGNEEFFTFYAPKGRETGETVTFVVENGEVKKTILGQTAKFLEQNQ